MGSSYCPDHHHDLPDLYHDVLRNMAICRRMGVRLPERFYEDLFEAIHAFERGEMSDAALRCAQTSLDYWLAAGEREARELERNPDLAEGMLEKELAALVRHSRSIARQHERIARTVRASGSGS